MDDCIFCSIISGQAPAALHWSNADWIAFDDIHPKAQTHVLVVSKKHIPSLEESLSEDDPVLSGALNAVKEVALVLGIGQRGYKVVINTGRSAGQIVDHLHLHIMSGTI